MSDETGVMFAALAAELKVECERQHARAEAAEARLRALEQAHERLRDLAALWMEQQAGYPTTSEGGRYAKAAVWLCATELLASLPAPEVKS